MSLSLFSVQGTIVVDFFILRLRRRTRNSITVAPCSCKKVTRRSAIAALLNVGNGARPYRQVCAYARKTDAHQSKILVLLTSIDLSICFCSVVLDILVHNSFLPSQQLHFADSSTIYAQLITM